MLSEKVARICCVPVSDMGLNEGVSNVNNVALDTQHVAEISAPVFEEVLDHGLTSCVKLCQKF